MGTLSGDAHVIFGARQDPAFGDTIKVMAIITGILTIGTASITIDGDNNEINVGVVTVTNSTIFIGAGVSIIRATTLISIISCTCITTRYICIRSWRIVLCSICKSKHTV